MILTVDIGNSNIVLGGYQEDGRLTFSTRLTTEHRLEHDQYAVSFGSLLALHGVQPESITGAVVASVVPSVTESVSDAVRMISGVKPLILSAESDSGLRIRTDNPLEVGADLICAAVAAKARFEMPALLIDMGTATTITAMDRDATVCGVVILPGVYISQDALKARTSQLPVIQMEAPAHVLGTNTIDCMKSGAVFGTAAMLDGMIERIEEELEPFKTIVATGGAAGGIIPCCRHRMLLDPDLVLEGLFEFYLYTSKRNG